MRCQRCLAVFDGARVCLCEARRPFDAIKVLRGLLASAVFADRRDEGRSLMVGLAALGEELGENEWAWLDGAAPRLAVSR